MPLHLYQGFFKKYFQTIACRLPANFPQNFSTSSLTHWAFMAVSSEQSTLPQKQLWTLLSCSPFTVPMTRLTSRSDFTKCNVGPSTPNLCALCPHASPCTLLTLLQLPKDSPPSAQPVSFTLKTFRPYYHHHPSHHQPAFSHKLLGSLPSQHLHFKQSSSFLSLECLLLPTSLAWFYLPCTVIYLFIWKLPTKSEHILLFKKIFID